MTKETENVNLNKRKYSQSTLINKLYKKSLLDTEKYSNVSGVLEEYVKTLAVSSVTSSPRISLMTRLLSAKQNHLISMLLEIDKILALIAVARDAADIQAIFDDVQVSKVIQKVRDKVKQLKKDLLLEDLSDEKDKKQRQRDEEDMDLLRELFEAKRKVDQSTDDFLNKLMIKHNSKKYTSHKYSLNPYREIV